MTSSSQLNSFLDSNQDGVLIIGHASALIRIDQKLILCDPVWGDYKPYGDNWAFVPDQINCDEILDKIDYCFISHIHADHVCEKILRKIPVDCYMMSGRKALQARLPRNWAIDPWHWQISYSKELEFYFVPHAFNAIDSSVFIRSKKTGYTVYHGNDNFLARTQLEQLQKDVPRVDVAMVPYAFIHWYPWLMKNMSEEEKLAETARLKYQSLKQAEMFVNFMKPKVTIPFGASLFFRGGPYHPLNKHLATPYDFTDAKPIIAGDYILSDGTCTTTPINEYQRLMNTDALDAPDRSQGFSDDYIGPIHLKNIARNVSRATFRIPNHEIVVNDIVINCEDLSVRRGPFGLHNYHHFEFERPEFYQWLNNHITFEEAIGTRRFVCTRVPNEYNYRVFDWMNNWL